LAHCRPRPAAPADRSGFAAHALLAPAAKRLAALSSQYHHAYGGVLARTRERVDQLHHRLRPEGIANLRAVDRDSSDAFGTPKGDVLVLTNRFPAHRFSSF